MININSYKLTPAITATWGDITGNVENQEDLIEYITNEALSGYATESWVSNQGYLTSIPSEYATQSWVTGQSYITSEALTGYATESWVEGKGYLTEHQDLSSYALKSEIPSLSGYATESWVSNQGYITNEALSGYATESWVESQGYITSSALSGYATESWVNDTLSSYALSTDIPSLDGYATQSWVSSNFLSEVPSGYATESWVESQNYVSAGNQNLAPLFSKSEGYLKYEPAEVLLSGSTNENQIVESANNAYIFRLVTTIGNDVYFYDINTMHMFKFNFVSFEFDDLGYMSDGTSSQVPLWADSQGRMYYGNQYKIDLENNMFIYSDLGGDVQIHTGSGRSNLVQRDGVTYLISKNYSCAYIFNEETQLFDSSIPITNSFPNNNYYRYLSEFEGHWIYDAGSTQTELVFHLDVAEPYVEWVTLENRLFPGAWTYEYEGQTINETTRGVFIHPVVKNGVRDWYTFGYANKVMYKLVNGAWEIVEYNQAVSGLLTNAGGCACGTLWFGFGYTSPSTNNGIIIWNLDTNDFAIPEVYGWDASVDTRFTSIESRVTNLESDFSNLNLWVNNIETRLSTLEQENLDTRLTALEQGYGDALSITNQILG